VWWGSRATLILADIHLGKIAHFRSAGIALPQSSARKDMQRLEALIAQYDPLRILILGDLFHSVENSAWQSFVNWRKEYEHIDFVLVEGNHDILEKHRYAEANIQLVEGAMTEEPFLFSHEPLTGEWAPLINVCGHVHPGVRMSGKGLSSVKLPCFFHTPSHFIFPAFSLFTGKYAVAAQEGDHVYVIADDHVIAVS